MKHKVIKRLVRFGNLDATVRLNFWRKLSQYGQIEEALVEEHGFDA